MTASATGTVDLQHETADLTVKADAPAMTPAPGVSWQSVLVDAKVHGPFLKPDANGTIKIGRLAAAGARIGALDADIAGNRRSDRSARHGPTTCTYLARNPTCSPPIRSP